MRKSVYFLPDVAVPETTCSAEATVSGEASDVATGARNPLLSSQSMPWSSVPFLLHLTSPQDLSLSHYQNTQVRKVDCTAAFTTKTHQSIHQ